MKKEVKEKFDGYPAEVRGRLYGIRELIFNVASEEDLGEITEALKWGEVSYSCKNGSPVRIDWKAKYPNQISVYFNCRTTLIETFREIYSDTFKFTGNREFAMTVLKPIPFQELKGCISMALRYHNIKHLPLLGA